jgi:hypothetical protein
MLRLKPEPTYCPRRPNRHEIDRPGLQPTIVRASASAEAFSEPSAPARRLAP